MAVLLEQTRTKKYNADLTRQQKKTWLNMRRSRAQIKEKPGLEGIDTAVAGADASGRRGGHRLSGSCVDRDHGAGRGRSRPMI